MVVMSKTSMAPISDLAVLIASFGFPNSKLVLQNKQIGNPNQTLKNRTIAVQKTNFILFM